MFVLFIVGVCAGVARVSGYRWADKVLAARGGEDRLVYVIAMLGLLRAAQGGGAG